MTMEIMTVSDQWMEAVEDIQAERVNTPQAPYRRRNNAAAATTSPPPTRPGSKQTKTYLPTYLPIYLPTYLPTCLPAYLYTYLLTYLYYRL